MCVCVSTINSHVSETPKVFLCLQRVCVCVCSIDVSSACLSVALKSSAYSEMWTRVVDRCMEVKIKSKYDHIVAEIIRISIGQWRREETNSRTFDRSRIFNSKHFRIGQHSNQQLSEKRMCTRCAWFCLQIANAQQQSQLQY